MHFEADAIVEVLLRERLRVTAAAAAAVVRDVHSADDIFQQVVLSALEHRADFRGPDHLLAWSLRTARHRALDMARRRQLRPLPDDVLDLLEDDWADQTGLPDRVEALHRCLEKLPTNSRQLLNMRYDRGMAVAAIAGRVRKSADAVYQNLSRIHRALRECVDRQLSPAAVSRRVSP